MKFIENKKGAIDGILAFIICIVPIVYIMVFNISSFSYFTKSTYIERQVHNTTELICKYGEVNSSLLDDLKANINKFGEFNYYYNIRHNINGVIQPSVRYTEQQLLNLRDLQPGSYFSIEVVAKEEDTLSKINKTNSSPVIKIFGTYEGMVEK